MVIYEEYGTNPLGVELIRAYSDAGFYIEREGLEYEEAIDPKSEHRTYTETEHVIEDEATADDYESALTSLGVNIDE